MCCGVPAPSSPSKRWWEPAAVGRAGSGRSAPWLPAPWPARVSPAAAAAVVAAPPPPPPAPPAPPAPALPPPALPPRPPGGGSGGTSSKYPFGTQPIRPLALSSPPSSRVPASAGSPASRPPRSSSDWPSLAGGESSAILLHPPSPLSRCIKRDGERASMTEVSPTASRAGRP